jgi:radical SAM superfamily enzyme YgiQ (UPF0313 family)
VVEGEYERGSVRALRGMKGKIDHDLLSVDDMNAAPFPMVDEGAVLNYWDACPVGQIAPQLQFWSSRGCPYRCCFCVFPAVMTGDDSTGTGKRAVRNYSKEYMEAFLREAVGRYHYRSMQDDADTMNLQERHTLEMCEVYGKIGLPWTGMCRADTSSRTTWMAMKQAGCTGVKLGFESGSQRVIDKIINKRLDLKEAVETARFIRSLGMNVHGTFTVGLPGEKPEEARMTVDLIRELYATNGINSHQLSGTSAIEGTPLDRIEHGEHLKAYDEARIDENYRHSVDGQLKAEETLR